MKKKTIKFMITFIVLIFSILFFNCSYSEAVKESKNEKTQSTLVELKEKELGSLEDYEKTYGSKSYGLTAYILRRVQIYSIPFCFLGIIVGAICDYVIGVRHLATKEKGIALMITFVTLGVICQVLPLIFTIVVKFGRE